MSINSVTTKILFYMNQIKAIINYTMMNEIKHNNQEKNLLNLSNNPGEAFDMVAYNCFN